MKKTGILLLVVWSIVLSASAQKKDNSLLWEVSGNGLSSPSYLFGTIHLMDDRIFSFDSTIYQKINACEALSGELDFQETNIPASMNDFFMKDTSLQDLYTKEEYKKVHNYLVDNLGILSFTTDTMKPIYTMSLISLMETQMDQAEPLDMYLQRYAREQGKKIIGIETMEEQQKALNSISLKEQAALLLETINMEDETDEGNITEKMITVYLKQDLKELDKLMESAGAVQSFEQNILLNRNEIMADRIDQFIQQQPTFNTFGAGHLKGKNGIIQLLRDKGYTVTLVSFEFRE